MKLEPTSHRIETVIVSHGIRCYVDLGDISLEETLKFAKLNFKQVERIYLRNVPLYSVKGLNGENLHAVIGGDKGVIKQEIYQWTHDDNLQAVFLDWFNNYLSIELFAEHYGLEIDHAENIIKRGREIHEARVKL